MRSQTALLWTEGAGGHYYKRSLDLDVLSGCVFVRSLGECTQTEAPQYYVGGLGMTTWEWWGHRGTASTYQLQWTDRLWLQMQFSSRSLSFHLWNLIQAGRHRPSFCFNKSWSWGLAQLHSAALCICTGSGCILLYFHRQRLCSTLPCENLHSTVVHVGPLQMESMHLSLPVINIISGGSLQSPCNVTVRWTAEEASLLTRMWRQKW